MATPRELQLLVLDYLLDACNLETAAIFARDAMGIDVPTEQARLRHSQSAALQAETLLNMCD